MIRLKEGVQLHDPVNPAQTISSVWGDALPVIDSIFTGYGSSLTVITSAFDGVHMPTSLHYKGQALDFRLWDVERGQRDSLTSDLAIALGPDFDVVLEADHLHIEFDPKE